MSPFKKYEPRTAPQAKPMEELFRSFLDTYKLNQKFDETYLLVFWEKIMGTPIAKRTSLLYIKNRVLFVHLNSAPLRQELLHSKSTIMGLIQKEVGSDIIEDIVIR
jgi:predicted nucleic acid-binding Zn ribbon protein